MEKPEQSPLETVSETTQELFNGVEKGHQQEMGEFLKLTDVGVPEAFEKNNRER